MTASAYLKGLAGALILLGMLVVLWPSKAGSPEERKALAAGRAVVVYWDRHFGHEHEARVELIQEYNTTQGIADGVYVRPVAIGYNAMMEKMLTSIAAGSPPDICSIDSSLLAQLAAQGCFTPLRDWMNAIPHLRQEEFFTHTWKMVEFAGFDADQNRYVTDVWGIPSTTDVYCLIWNKDAFRRAGLDPERPPRTVEELEAYAEKLTLVGPAGIEQVGFLPWFPWDLTYMWGELFGGVWYDQEAGWAVCDGNPGVIESLEWQRRFSAVGGSPDQLPFALNPSMVQSYAALGSYQSANNPFYSGRVAMITEGEWQATFIPKYAPGLDWGVAPLPVPAGREPRAYSPTSVVDAVSTGAPNLEAALQFLEWFYAPRPDGRPSPVSDYNRAISNIPCREAEAMQERFLGDEKFGVYVNQLLEYEVILYPVSPEAQFMLDEVSSNREYVVFGQKTPEQAARDVQHRVNTKLGQTYRLMQRSPE